MATNVLQFDFSQVGVASGLVNKVRDMVMSAIRKPLEQMVAQVLAGKWKGEGANAFAREMSEIFLPNVGTVDTHLGGILEGMQKAAQVMINTQNQATQIAKQIGDLFSGI